MTVLPWRRSRAEERARALHPSAASRRGPTSPLSLPRAADSRAAVSGRGPDGPVVRLCSDARCRRYLSGSTEGRLSYPTGRGPETLVVPYVLSEQDSVLIPVAPFNEACQYVPGRMVTLEVTGSSVEFERWVVRVSGRAGDRLLRSRSAVGAGGLHLPDPPPVPPLDTGEIALLELPLSSLRGFGLVTSRPGGADLVRSDR